MVSFSIDAIMRRHIYIYKGVIMSNSEEGNCKKPEETLNSPSIVIEKRFKKVIKTINEELGKDYAPKNPDLIRFLMVEISQEIEMRNRPTN